MAITQFTGKQVKDTTIDIVDINATGTPGSSNFLRGDGVWADAQPLDADLTSWAGVTRASGFDTFAATPSSANLKALLTDELGDSSGKAIFALGTLAIASGKTLTASNTLTLTATDGSTLAVGAGGTLGSNAYTSTAYAPLASPTFTGTPAAPTAAAGTNTTQLATTAFVTTPQNKCCRVTASGNQSINNATLTAITFDTEIQDTDAMHDNSTNPTRLTCKTAGNYIITGSVRWAGNATGHRGVGLRLNGGNYISSSYQVPDGSVAFGMETATIRALAVNDYVELYVEQTSGGALNHENFSEFTPILAMARIA